MYNNINHFRCNFMGEYPLGFKIFKIFYISEFRHPSNIIPEIKNCNWRNPEDVEYKGRTT